MSFMIIRRHHVRSVPLELFAQALDAGHECIVDAQEQDLDEMVVGEPVVDPEKFKFKEWSDRMLAGMGGIMSVFPDDRALGTDCFKRIYTMMPLISKRCFKRYRHGTDPDGSIRISEAFLLAAATMPLTNRQMAAYKPFRRRQLKKRFAREVRRQERIEAAQSTK